MIPIQPPLVVPHSTQSWRLRWLLAAPHRLAFFGAAVMLSVSALWWCAVLFARVWGLGVPWAVSSGTAHALVMSMCFTPLFFAGFMFTAGPRWLNMPEVGAAQLLPAVSATVLGWLISLVGFHGSTLVAGAGVLIVALAWTTITFKFMQLWHYSPSLDKAHANVMVLSFGAGVVGLWLAAAGLFASEEAWVRMAAQGSIWCFVASVFATVSHRMIPFFSASAIPKLDAWRPFWLLWVTLFVLWFEGLVAVVDLLVWPGNMAFRWVQVGVEAPTALLILWLAMRWGLVQSLKIRLLAMLHGGFVWLGLALALQAVSHTMLALSQGQSSLGLAPLHALTVGYLGATMMAMATRVSSGHGGRPLAADGLVWGLYWVLQLAALLRVMAALWPAAGAWLALVAISTWTFATCAWSLRYGSWFGRPRLDGRPG